MTTFNTYVIDTDFFKAVKQLSANVSQEDADLIESQEEHNYNSLDYFIQSYEHGSERDVECQQDIIQSQLT